jgi:hypothetical protein
MTTSMSLPAPTGSERPARFSPRAGVWWRSPWALILSDFEAKGETVKQMTDDAGLRPEDLAALAALRPEARREIVALVRDLIKSASKPRRAPRVRPTPAPRTTWFSIDRKEIQ